MNPMLEDAKATIMAGIDWPEGTFLFPGLRIEYDDAIYIKILCPDPEPDEAMEVVMQWKKEMVSGVEACRRRRRWLPWNWGKRMAPDGAGPSHAVWFMASPETIKLGLFPPSEGEWHTGRVDRKNRTVEWD